LTEDQEPLSSLCHHFGPTRQNEKLQRLWRWADRDHDLTLYTNGTFLAAREPIAGDPEEPCPLPHIGDLLAGVLATDCHSYPKHAILPFLDGAWWKPKVCDICEGSGVITCICSACHHEHEASCSCSNGWFRLPFWGIVDGTVVDRAYILAMYETLSDGDSFSLGFHTTTTLDEVLHSIVVVRGARGIGAISTARKLTNPTYFDGRYPTLERASELDLRV